MTILGLGESRPGESGHATFFPTNTQKINATMMPTIKPMVAPELSTETHEHSGDNRRRASYFYKRRDI